jgi:tRNA pseudouridine13 synthase
MISEPLLKYRPEDFLVRENLVVATTDDEQAGQQYLVLHKRGYTTMEAVRLIAEKLAVPTRQITYGGLKDEDGVTEQLVAIPSGTLTGQADGSGWRPADEPGRWLLLRHYGYGREPLRVGGLEGNGFRIVVRNIEQPLADRLAALRKVNLLFLNYYDTQRFGVPGGPKLTHRVGASILAGDWATALRDLIALKSPESELAGAWQGPAAGFFRQLDPRTAAFYLAAHASDNWNTALRAMVGLECPGGGFARRVDGLDYRYAESSQDAATVMAAAHQLPYDKFTFEDGRPVRSESIRPTVVQSVISVGQVAPDDRIDGRSEVTLTFFLPSGCYATAAVRQFLGYVGLGNH